MMYVTQQVCFSYEKRCITQLLNDRRLATLVINQLKLNIIDQSIFHKILAETASEEAIVLWNVVIYSKYFL